MVKQIVERPERAKSPILWGEYIETGEEFVIGSEGELEVPRKRGGSISEPSTSF